MAGLLALSLLTAGCGSTTPTKSVAVSVKAMKVLQQDTAVSHDYSGQIKSTNAVTIKPRVSGEIVEKYFTAGDPVEKGQPLYKIDDRQYESEVLSAKSNVDKARTTLNNSLVDLNCYQQLVAASGAVAEQTLTNQQATVDSNQSSYDDANALLQKALENLDDTIIRAPISGKLAVDDVPSGTYVTAGNTALVSVGSINPIYVQFSIRKMNS
ncbi:efflux RND transporter periplasmic adaptor subunit [Megasphaera sp.]|uniref:efflux RND transporter periplasmic adaptor subunit n=1 Tax=Megasphaera sp. TaxID=2023260 RepID=UPI003F7F6BDB